jgi:aminoglycoside phosphotransferase (APT) family kinase protein
VRATALTDERALCVVHTLFPSAPVASWQPVPGEHENALYTLILSDRTETVLKIYAAGTDPDDCTREVQLLRILTAETDVPVPRVLHYSMQLPWEQAGEGSYPWVLLSRLPGTPLLQVMGGLEDAELEAVGYELGRYLAHLHQIPLNAFGCVFGSGPHDRAKEKEYVLSQVIDWSAQYEKVDLLAPETRSQLRRRFEETGFLDRHRACLTHAALSARNVMVEDAVTGYHVTGLLDLAHAQGSSPELDVARLFAWSFQAVPVARKGFLDGYTEAGELSPHFWERLRLYQAFVALGILLKAHRQADAPLMQQAAEQIQSFVDSPGPSQHGNLGGPIHV